MIEEDVLIYFDDVDLTDSIYDLKDVFSIVDVTDIIAVKGIYNQIFV